MDGIIANLSAICDLAEQYDAMVMVDDSHAVGVLGENGKGTLNFCKVEGRVDIVTGTLGKALGGASGGYTCASRQIYRLVTTTLATIPIFKFTCTYDCCNFATDFRYGRK